MSTLCMDAKTYNGYTSAVMGIFFLYVIIEAHGSYALLHKALELSNRKAGDIL